VWGLGQSPTVFERAIHGTWCGTKIASLSCGNEGKSFVLAGKAERRHHTFTHEEKRGGQIMIELTRLNGTKITVNALLIEQLESTPDTVVTLTTGRKVVVRESVEDVTRKATEYLSSLREGGAPINVAQLGRVIQ
jgi:flagellar protein FlbD